jgi:hypothetical protein
MNKIVMVGGGKGGVGKSTVVFSVVDLLITNGQTVVLVESDDSNPDTYKSLKNLIKSELCNLDKEEGFIKLGNIIQANNDACIVVNTAERATSSIVKHGGILRDVVLELKRELVMLWPMNRQRDSIELLKIFLDGTSGYSETYALLNTYFGVYEKFVRFDQSKQKDRVTGTLIFPELNDLVADKLFDDRLALSNAESVLSISERSVLRRYREDANDVLKVLL